MPQGQLRGRPANWVVFDGASLGNLPLEATYPDQLMAGRGVGWTNLSQDGWQMPALLDGVASRLWRQAIGTTHNVIVLMAGTNDIFFGGRTGEQIYADMVTYGESARAHGFDHVIGTTICPSVWFDAFPLVMWPRWETANELIRADALNAFNHVGVADVAAGALLSDTSSAGYTDGTHFSVAGAAEAAAIIAPFLDEALTGDD